MLELQSTFRRLAFFAYVGMVPAIPLGILWGKPGMSLGLFISLLWLAYIRATTDLHIWKILGLKKVLKAEQSTLFNLVHEHCRRLQIAVPQIALFPSRNITLGAYGFAERDMVLFVSSGLLDSFSREELSAAVAWELTHIWHKQVPCETWLAGFLLTLGQKPNPNAWTFVKQAMVLPIGFVPMQVLACRSQKSSVTDKAARLSQLPWELDQALRKMGISLHKEPLNIPLGVAHLFAITPPARDPLSRVLFQATGQQVSRAVS